MPPRLSYAQRKAIMRLYLCYPSRRYPDMAFKAHVHRLTANALVRKGYATQATHNRVQLTQAGIVYARTGEELGQVVEEK